MLLDRNGSERFQPEKRGSYATLWLKKMDIQYMDKIFKPCPHRHMFQRVLTKVMLGVWFLSSIGANAHQVTLTWNFEGEGVVVVLDRRV